MSEAEDEFYKVAGDRVLGKSDDQLRRHKAPQNWLKAVGDTTLAEVTTDGWFRAALRDSRMQFEKVLAARSVRSYVFGPTV